LCRFSIGLGRLVLLRLSIDLCIPDLAALLAAISWIVAPFIGGFCAAVGSYSALLIQSRA